MLPRLPPVAVLCLLAACTVDAIELEGLECPCIGGFVCDAARNVCVAVDGIDAGAADAAATDATSPPPDTPAPAMTDGAPRDAGAPDAGAADAGIADAGPVDGGTQTTTLDVAIDTYVDDTMTTTSFADASELRVDESPYLGALIQFEDPGIPPGTEIISATIELTCFDPGGDVLVNALTEAWDATVTWDTRPNRDAATVATFTPADGLITIDVTSLVQRWVDGDLADHGVLFLTASTNGSDYYSSEHTVPAERPRLVVVHR